MLHEGPRIVTSIETESGRWLPRARVGAEGELFQGHRVSVTEDEKVLEVDGVMVAQQRE